MKPWAVLRVSVVSLAAIALLGLAACSPKKPAYVCEAGATTAASEPRNTAPPPRDPLDTQGAGEEAKAAVAEAELVTPDGRVPLVTVEQTPGGPEITSTPVANEAEAEAVAEAAASDGDLVAVEPDSIVTAEGTDPNDPQFPHQYALPQVGFDATWASDFSGPTSGLGQTVGVLDTGVDVTHQDLDEPGRVMQPGASFVGGTATIDPNGHGTFVAGIIAAETNNMTDVSGAAPAAKILPVQVLDAAGEGLTSNVAAGIMWAADQGATVLNLSLGGSNPSDAMRFAVQYAVFTKGVPVIASAGNTSKCGSPSYPAAFDEVVAVGATDAGNNRAGFSTTGPYLDVVAPGVEIRSTSPPGTVTTRTGTSFSAPYAAAAAAIVRATHTAFDTSAVYFRMMTTATDLGSPGWDPEFGWGLINVPAATAP